MSKTSGVLWPRFSPQVAVQPVGDLGELAARLGSPVTYSRSGTVMFADGFEDGLSPYELASSDPTYLVSLSTTISFRGAQSAKFFHDKDEISNPRLLKHIPLYRTGKMGFEFHFRNESDNEIFTFGLSKQEGGIFYSALIKITVSDGTIKYFDSEGTFTTIETLDLTVGAFKAWHAVKLFVDYDTNSYVRLWVDDNEYLLTDLALWNTVSVEADYLMAEILLNWYPGNDLTMYVDDFIVSVDET